MSDINTPTNEGQKIEKKELPKRVAIYLRCSTKEQSDMYGPDVQMKAIQKFLEYKKDEYVLGGEEYIYNDSDEAVSGKEKFEDRKQGSRLVSDIESFAQIGEKPFDVVLVWKLDRLARKVDLVYDFLKILEENEIGLISTTELFDIRTPFGKAVVGILAVFAELEREMILQRTGSGQLEAKEDGVQWKQKYGYRKDVNGRYAKEHLEAGYIEKIFNRYVIEGRPISWICSELSDEKAEIPTYAALRKDYSSDSENDQKQKSKKIDSFMKKGTQPYKWNDKTVRKILADATYIGKYYYNKTEKQKDRITGKVKEVEKPQSERKLSRTPTPVIVSETIFIEAQKRLSKASNTKYIPDSSYLLSTLLYCDYCKKNAVKYDMVTRQGAPQSGGGKEIYRCSGKRTDRRTGDRVCTCIPLDRADLDRLVILHVVALLNNPKAIDRIINLRKIEVERTANIEDEIKSLQNEHQQVQKAIENANKSFNILGTITEKEYVEYISISKEKNVEIQKKLVELNIKMKETVDTKSYLDVLTLIKHKLETSLHEISNNPSKMKNLLTLIVDKIIIYSKEVTDDDVLPGKKSKNKQAIPYKIKIILKLPQEYLQHIQFSYSEVDFGVEKQSGNGILTSTAKKRSNRKNAGKYSPIGVLHTKESGSPLKKLAFEILLHNSSHLEKSDLPRVGFFLYIT